METANTAEDFDIGSTEHFIALAECLENQPEEITLGPTDSELCARALRFYVASWPLPDRAKT